MAGKINRLLVIFIWILIIGLLIYSRFVNLGWGLPYPMHPDERNMATAIQQLNCTLPQIALELPKSLIGKWEPITKWIKLSGNFNVNECFNPHFFAYGQLPLYLGYIFAVFFKLFNKSLFTPRSKLRFAGSLVALGMTAGVIIFSPYAIQFAHFGTTESLLMLFYSLIIYFSILYIDNKTSTRTFIFGTAAFSGMALGTKVSSLIFLAVPYFSILFHNRSIAVKRMISSSKSGVYFVLYKVIGLIFDLSIFLILTILFFVLFSPHNLISFKEFLGSMNYETDVAFGKYVAFYTKQFIETTPIIFQFEKIFPYVLGAPVFLFGILGFLILSWKDKKINLLRIAFISSFVTSAFFFAKWTRFIAPTFPLMSIFAILFISKVILTIYKLRFARSLVVAFLLLGMIWAAIKPGIEFLSIYQKPDIRFQASDWIYKNIPENSYILSETANVVDIPIENPKSKVYKVQSKNYNIISFNFYDLDENPELQLELKEHLEKADYIFVPSRRIFANHTCNLKSPSFAKASPYVKTSEDKSAGKQISKILNINRCEELQNKYPQLNEYYEKLFSGELGFSKVAEFSSGQNDEAAEETFTVFDHPVIRIKPRLLPIFCQFDNCHRSLLFADFD
ncbi:MAG: hypothetical protein UR68_C0029G0002 [Candidatus Roizmanbacteria bacterium GW2011_GWA2_35_19]|uniref:Glycosyltransferase RgtA/B/C/D-like domain-containing protein n=1 Tax=Candidatus Roizmanbacteria bacterium GW2011_GWA2_35_19 TaxID=1618478 RepID=A0A0G0BQ27_9BACT|nr:MAG: hypothetical protein UR68_C0029G0002 [Candidatus Roizmanbacteria bacterium GW2011_GWA2_35_19]